MLFAWARIQSRILIIFHKWVHWNYLFKSRLWDAYAVVEQCHGYVIPRSSLSPNMDDIHLVLSEIWRWNYSDTSLISCIDSFYHFLLQKNVKTHIFRRSYVPAAIKTQ